jgi:hypothetical protein
VIEARRILRQIALQMNADAIDRLRRRPERGASRQTGVSRERRVFSSALGAIGGKLKS